MWFLDVRFLRVDVIFVVLLISSSSSCVCIAPPPLPPPPQRIQYSSDVLFRFSCVCAKLVLYGIPLLFLLFSPSLSPFSFLSDFSCIFFLRYSLPLMRYLRVISLLIWLSVYLRASLCYLWFIGALISDSVIVRSRYFRSVVRNTDSRATFSAPSRFDLEHRKGLRNRSAREFDYFCET